MPDATESSAAESHGEHEELPLFLRDYIGWLAITLLVLGRKTGMVDAIMKESATAAELSQRCHVDTRNAQAWLAAMTAHGYVTHDGGRFTMVASEAAVLRGDALPFDFLAVLDFSERAPRILSDVAEAIRTGRGVRSAVYHDVLGDAAARVNTPLYRAMLLDDWLTKAGVADDLRRGIDVAELASGTGAALIELAARCPASRFTGYDLDAAAVQRAADAAAKRGVANVRFRAADASALDAAFDLVMVLDALHHFGRPQAVLQAVARSLRPNGRLVIAEATATGDLDADAASPFGRIVLSSDVLYCLQEGLHDGGVGLGAAAGADKITSLLKQNGFDSVNEYVTGTGYTVFTASR